MTGHAYTEFEHFSWDTLGDCRVSVTKRAQGEVRSDRPHFRLTLSTFCGIHRVFSGFQ